ncbi:unnamed protein product [Rhizophagus irregularis]|nr:unnamed protein product [Rhizophagus irregularis]
MFINLNDILDHVAMFLDFLYILDFKGTLGFLYMMDFEGFPDFLYITDFKGTPGFCTHWTFKGTWFHFFILFS